MRQRVRGLLVGGAAAIAVAMWAAALVAQMPQTRTISLRNIHTDDVVSVEYKRNGRYVPEAMERINWVMRDWRRDESTRMDPTLIDLLWEMHHELGSKEPINIISAYRSRSTNNMLRRSVGGQASESRHILGKAADVQFPDVPVKHIRYAAMVRERGGVGYYPTSATPFVHVDTDRVRAWPRMPRFELALLFPNGRTQHKPADGGDITMDDVRTAKARHGQVAVQLAGYHDLRRNRDVKEQRAQPSLMTALAPGVGEPVFTPPPPVSGVNVSGVAMLQRPLLVATPRLADRPSRLSPRPSEDDRRTLTQLVALAGMPELVAGPAPAVRARSVPDDQAPKRRGRDPAADTAAPEAYPRMVFLSAAGIESLQGWSTGFTPAPAWDEDHPEEAAYRPFPLAPFLTETASIDDPALTRMVHPDLSRTAELFETSGAIEPMRLRPGRSIAKLMWAQEAGSAVAADLSRLGDAPRALAARLVQTQPR